MSGESSNNNDSTILQHGQLKWFNSGNSGELGTAVSASLIGALNDRHKLSQFIFDMRGFSGRKYRMFINNLVGVLPDARYLEVGSWAGSTLCSAIFTNKVQALAIDNWSQFQGPVNEFFRNVSQSCSPATSLSVLTRDFRDVDYSTVGKYNIYLYDGPHEEEDQYDGLALALPALDDEFVFIVDDWNWPGVRSGTHNAIKDNGLEIVLAAEIISHTGDEHAIISGRESSWHNGYFISVLRKQK